jgi:hypothetical protein
MKKVLLILCFTGLVGFKPEITSKSVEESSPTGFINITVLSNFGKQLFEYNIKQQCLSAVEEQGARYIKDNKTSSIIIPVKDFKCINKSAYKDLLSLLKVDQYPNLEIDIPDNSNIKYISEKQVILKGVSFNIAGVTRQYDVWCRISNTGTVNQILSGTTRLKLTDLEIVPPTKFLGLIKVNDEIIVDFSFCMRSIG